ncbi:MAG TPA: DUF3352 domain-containing protein [Solirubrobacteraceae bacterium]
MRRLSHLCVLASAAAVLLAGCGGGAAAGDADPATIMPATAAVYLEGVVRPEGDQREDVLDAASKILRTDDPEKKLRELFDEAVEKDGQAKLDWDKDVEPWLGERAGLVVTNLQADEPDALLAVAAKDTDRAQESVNDALARDGKPLRDASYRGTDYKVNAEKVAVGVVKDFIAFGDEAQFKQAVDAAKGKSLAEEKRFKSAIEDLEDDRIGTAFVDPAPLFDAAAKQDPESSSDIEQARRLFGLDKLEPIAAALVADGERIAIDSSAPVSEGSSLFARLTLLQAEGPGEMLGELPADSWLAYGIPKLGESAKAVYDQFAGALGGAAVASQIKQATGLDLQQDVFSWIGDTALFVRGETESSLEGALVIEATDPAKARTAVTRLVGAAAKQNEAFGPQPVKLPGADVAFQISGAGTPQRVIVAVGKDRAVIAMGDAAARDALAPADKLADADAFKTAVDALEDGSNPSLYLSMPAVVKLAAASDGDDPEFQQARPYLEALAAVVAGGKKDGDRAHSRVAVTLK